MMLLFFSSLCMVFLLGMQQQNVTHKHHGASVITSMGLALAQVTFIQHTAAGPFWHSALALWLGGALGASLSMVLHGHLIGALSRLRRNGVIGEVVE